MQLATKLAPFGAGVYPAHQFFFDCPPCVAAPASKGGRLQKLEPLQ
jgi:hypothetical protein